MTESTVECPVCRSMTSGRFCSNCGTPLGARTCGKCGKPVQGRGAFCPHCGSAVGPAVPALTSRTPWIVAAIAGAGLLILLIVVLAKGQRAPDAGAQAGPFASGGTGAPPDISSMTPRERFDRLYNRVMAAAESGDQSTVTQFTPMAVTAFSQLDTVDADARFHLALLSIHTGDATIVEAQADTILIETPGHLFAYMIRGARARFAQDSVALRQAYADFLGHYEAEQARQRPEYGEHKRSVDDFRKAALASR